MQFALCKKNQTALCVGFPLKINSHTVCVGHCWKLDQSFFLCVRTADLLIDHWIISINGQWGGQNIKFNCSNILMTLIVSCCYSFLVNSYIMFWLNFWRNDVLNCMTFTTCSFAYSVCFLTVFNLKIVHNDVKHFVNRHKKILRASIKKFQVILSLFQASVLLFYIVIFVSKSISYVFKY